MSLARADSSGSAARPQALPAAPCCPRSPRQERTARRARVPRRGEHLLRGDHGARVRALDESLAQRRPRLRRHPRLTVELFELNPDVLESYTGRYVHVHIDEFQDTNIAQYVLAEQWRLAPSQHLRRRRPRPVHLSLARRRHPQHPQLRARLPRSPVVILEQNYRSTQTILDAAHSVIALNKQRKEKNLWTENGEGAPIVVHEAYRRGRGVRLRRRGAQAPDARRRHVADQDIAVMYRTNAQSRAIEERCSSGAASPTGSSAVRASTNARGEGPARLPPPGPEPVGRVASTACQHPAAAHRTEEGRAHPRRGDGARHLARSPSLIGSAAGERATPPCPTYASVPRADHGTWIRFAAQPPDQRRRLEQRRVADLLDDLLRRWRNYHAVSEGVGQSRSTARSAGRTSRSSKNVAAVRRARGQLTRGIPRGSGAGVGRR